MGRQRLLARPGDVVVVPPGTVHHFANPGTVPVHVRGGEHAGAVHGSHAGNRRGAGPRPAAAGRMLPRPVDLALFMGDFDREVRAPYLPARPVRAALRPLARAGEAPGLRHAVPAAAATAGHSAFRRHVLAAMLAIEVRDLVKRYRGRQATRLTVSVRRSRRAAVLPARSERRGQDHDSVDPDDRAGPHLRARARRGARPGHRPDGDPREHRHRLPAAVARPQLDRGREHPPARHALRPLPVAAVVPVDARRLPGAGRASSPTSSASPAYLGRPVRSLSGGTRRKLEIVRALMHRPRVLFFDEPSTGLDPQSRRSLWSYLGETRTPGRHDHRADHALPGRSRVGRRGLRPDSRSGRRAGQPGRNQERHVSADLEEAYLTMLGNLS